MKKIILTALLFVFAPVIAVAKPQVVASINPIYQILTEIVGDEADVVLVINPNITAHHYQLKRKDVRAVHGADLVFYVDDALEKNLSKLVSDKKSARNLSGIQGMTLLNKRQGHKIMDLHIWLNPRNAIRIAEHMATELAAIDPDSSKVYQTNLVIFKKKLLSLEERIFKAIENSSTSGHVLFTQDYQYFEEYFGFKPLKVIFNSHGHDLRMSDVREFDALVKKGKVTCVFGDVYDESNAVQKLARNHGLKYIALDLIGSEKNYFQILADISDEIASCS